MSQLRSFAQYGNVGPYTPFAFPCVLCDLDGFVAAAGWLQIHDNATGSLTGAVPLKSFQITGAGPIPSLFQTLGGVTLFNGLTIAMSSTEGTYTAVGTSFDAFGEIDEYEGIDVTRLGSSTVGDISTPRNTLQVWANGTSPSKTLYKLIINEVMGAKRFVIITATDTLPSSPKYPAMPLAASSTLVLNFGDGGYQPQSGQSPVSSLYFNGCSIWICDADSNGNLKVPLAQTANTANIKAWFK